MDTSTELHPANPYARVRVNSHDLIALRLYAAAIDMSSGLVRSKQTGNRLSTFKGRGMDYEESRRYQYGDDRRNLDWRVMARTGIPHTKLFREERERPVYLCLDVRPSMQFATQGSFKSVIAARALALVGWAAFGHGDRVGGVVFGGAQRLERRPARGKRAILNWIHDVSRDENWLVDRSGESRPALTVDDKSQSVAAGEHLQDKLQRIFRVSRPGSLLVIATDWRDFDDATENQLMKLAQHNTLLLFFVYDPLEKSLPPPGVYAVTSGKSVLAMDSRNANRRNDYAKEFEQRRARVHRAATKIRATCIDISTDDDVKSVVLRALR
ncbi:MAG: DUF58 domain-containing protein [Gammaproteobacteria bacterium]